MSSSLAKTKRRIRAVTGTRKLTGAMELIALAKLRRGLSEIEANRSFLKEFGISLARLALMEKERQDEKKHSGRRLLIAVYSDLGLCGPYNGDMDDFLERELGMGDLFYPIGDRSRSFLARKNPDIDETLPTLDLNARVEDCLAFAKALIAGYGKGNYSRVSIAYTHYVNSLRNVVLLDELLPLSFLGEAPVQELASPPELDLKAEKMLQVLLPSYLSSLIRARLLESSMSEQSARRLAMENANDNADELLEELNIAYNKARQAAITQEIVEVVAGSAH